MITNAHQPGQWRISPVLILSRPIFGAVFTALGGIKVTGTHNLPHTGRAILCPNHISDCDPAAILCACSRNDINALAKSELFDYPLLGPYIRAIGALPIKRDSSDRAALRTAESVLFADRMLLIFPEGRLSQSGLLQRAQPGAMMLALKTNSPVIPIGLRGTNKVLPYGAIRPGFAGGGVRVTIGEAISPQQYAQMSHKAALEQMNVDVAAEIARLTHQEVWAQ